MQRTLVFVLFATSVSAQFWYVPNNAANVGTCNVIPFGSTTLGSFGTAKYQTIVSAADLGNLPGVITGLGFAVCAPTGNAHYSSLEIVMDHIAPNSVLNTTFASNLTPNAVTVLLATDYTWHVQADTWIEIGLQNFFVYDGVDDLVVQVTSVNGTAPAGFHRDVRQRVYAIGWTGSPPATGTSGLAALKMEIAMLMARTSVYGDGCNGSNGLPPQLSFGGSSQLGQTLQYQLTQGPVTSLAFLALGFGNGAPFPLDLGILGMPGCKQYFGVSSATAVFTDPVGGASISTVVPASAALVGILFYAQWACFDPPANAMGITSSDYGRVLVGN